ncbi:hypothetical protein E4U31_004068 [Claviceps sp. LM219 group G6]|nr:hypothetical protein E4U31_004068 [Claviceps sp. LM219 group G6]
MQSWTGPGQNGTGGQSSWPADFGFGGQDDQFDPSQSWPLPVADQTDSFSHMTGHQDEQSANFFDASHQDEAFSGGGLHLSQGGNAAFHGGHSSLGLNQQFAQPDQDVIDPAFNDIHSDVYGQQPKDSLSLDQNHSHQQHHGPVENYGQHDFQFPGQTENAFNAAVAQYDPNQLLPRTGSRHGQPPVQHFDGLQNSFQQEQHFSRQPQETSSVQQQRPYSHGQDFAQNVNSQSSHFVQDPNLHLAFQQQQKQQDHQDHQQQSRQQPRQLHTSNPSAHLQTHLHNQQALHNADYTQKSGAFSQFGQPTQPTAFDPSLMQATYQISLGGQPPASTSKSSPAAGKRKRPLKDVSEPSAAESLVTFTEFPLDVSAKKSDDVDALPVPVPTVEEAKLIANFKKRNKAAQAKYPSIRGLPHFLYEGTVKLPAPKSFDKLAPLVALPPRSGQPIVPELGFALPCEVQGRFTSKYRPSAEKSGFDERRAEAKILLDEYDQSMRNLGKRQPKYTEYPHALKEQLKSDEASKNKAEKKAKKSLEGDRQKPIRPATRPADPAEAAAWDAIGFVHVDQATQRTSSLIAGRVQQAGDFLIKLRTDMNRSKLDLDQAVKNKLSGDIIAKKRNDSEQKKEALYRALDATVEHADDAVLDNLGGHQKLILSLVNSLISSIKASDFSGKLPKIVLELFTHFRMTRKIVETTNFDTVRKRFEDKGDDEVKELVREITTKIRRFQKASEPETATGYAGTSASGRAKAGGKQTVPLDGSASVKRGRDEESDTRTVKKIAVEAGSSSLSKKLAQPKISSSTNKTGVMAKPVGSTMLPGKTRPVVRPPAVKALAKSDALGVNSPTPVDDKSKIEVKKITAPIKPSSEGKATPSSKLSTSVSSPSSSSSAVSGIASLLDSINSKKTEAASAVSKESKVIDSFETPVQRAKRLRKEARKKLRVSWKPEEELVQVKIFQKDDREDEGRDVNMIRDAADDRSEGMVLKQRADVDEEDDDDDIPYQPWASPNAVDFSHLPSDVRNKSYITRGGHITFSTEEQRLMAEREQRELMAIYTDIDDIPATPRSPLAEQVATHTSNSRKAGYVPTDDVKFEELQLRWREEQNMGVDRALSTALGRIEAKNNPSTKLDTIFGRLKAAPTHSNPSQQAAAASYSSPPHDQFVHHRFPFGVGSPAEELVLACLQSDKVRTWRDLNPILLDPARSYHYGDKNLQMIGNHIETVAKHLAPQPYPATSPPDWLAHDQEREREWWLGYNKEMATKQRKLDEERARAEAEANALRLAASVAAAGGAIDQGQQQDWNAYYQQQQQQQQAYAPYLALLQQMTGGQTLQPATFSDVHHGQPGQNAETQLQSILAAINQPQQQQASQGASVNFFGNLNTNDPSYQQLLLLAQMTQGQQGQPSLHPPPPAAATATSHTIDRERERERDRDRDRDRGESRDKDNKDGRKKKATLPPHKPANKALIGTKACTFWQQGKCARGDKCTFRHD